MRRWRELPIAGYGTTKVGPINHLRSGMLSYVTPEWVHAMRPVGVITDPPIILCSQECRDIVADRGGIPSNSSDPAGEFWAAVNSAVPGSLWGPESDNKIAASAVVHPYAHVGVPAFKVFRGKLCPSFGGVTIGEHSSIGANTCIARGIFGEYTEIGDNVHIDNLVHVGHSAIIGNGTTIAANSTIGGWAEIGEGCRIETSVTVFQSVKIGAGSRIGSGSVVTKDVPPGAVAYGNPCRVVREAA